MAVSLLGGGILSKLRGISEISKAVGANVLTGRIEFLQGDQKASDCLSGIRVEQGVLALYRC